VAAQTSGPRPGAACRLGASLHTAARYIFTNGFSMYFGVVVIIVPLARKGRATAFIRVSEVEGTTLFHTAEAEGTTLFAVSEAQGTILFHTPEAAFLFCHRIAGYNSFLAA